MSEDELRDLSAFFIEFHNETDRGAALVGAAMIDQKLAETVRSFMVDCKAASELLDGANAPLGTFSARIKICHALGLIDGHEFSECDLIRKIRNEFAHRVHGTTFADAKIKSLCHRLQPAVLSRYQEPFDGTTRDIFICAVVERVARLTWRDRWAVTEKRTPLEGVSSDQPWWRGWRVAKNLTLR